MSIPSPGRRSKIVASATRYAVTTTQQRTPKLTPGTYEIWATADTRYKMGGATVAFAAIPVVSTVTPTGTPGSTHWTYKALEVDAEGKKSAISAGVQTTTGHAAPLDGTNYNAIAGTCSADAVAVEVWRTEGGATQGKIATVTPAAGAWTYNDQGAAGDGATAPTSATSIGGALFARAPRWFEILDAADATTNGYIALVTETSTSTVEIAKVT